MSGHADIHAACRVCLRAAVGQRQSGFEHRKLTRRASKSFVAALNSSRI